MILLIISFLLILIGYIAISKYERSFMHVFFPFLIIFLPANYILVIIYHLVLGIDIRYTFGFVYVYACYTVFFVLFMLFYRLNIRLPLLRVPLNKQNEKLRFVYFSILFLLLSFLLYLPIMIRFKEFLLQPREIYIRTRLGYGIYYFLSLFLLKLSFIFSLFSSRKMILKSMTILLIVLLTYFHGSKGAMVSLFFIYIIYKVYYNGEPFSILKGLGHVTIAVILIIISFWLTFKGIRWNQILLTVSTYSDYTRNATKLIDNYEHYFNQYYYGQLMIEDNTISKIPRIVYPDKPRSFGSFKLAKAVYPEWFARNVGDPSFGLVGRVYADFGVFAIFYLSILAILKGILLKWAVKGLRITRNIFYFILTLHFAGVNLISVGIGEPFLEHFVIAILLLILLQFRIFA